MPSAQDSVLYWLSITAPHLAGKPQKGEAASSSSSSSSSSSAAPAAKAAAPAPAAATAAPKKAEEKPAKNDDDFDLFGEEDEEDEEEHERELARRAEEARAKKAAEGKVKATVIARSSVILDVKVWEEEAKMDELEAFVRAISLDGLEWKASKILPVAYGIKKLQISAHIEDDKVSVDSIQEQIEANEDMVQSTDVVAFNKL
eukprot:TRINITY_DN365_c0_g1_i2.p1 TRINITY_DN365_c0_g1~~TRINITY_DN365_c0_g1_i2.p1  ORF type:complete len:220 (-),score=89.78 TRINITY_DN365_c0_g1_i2:168-773(-)